MSNQLQITGGAKVKNLEGAIVGSSGVLSSVGLGVANGVATLGTDGKVPSSQLPTLASSYKGTWNAATNTPTIADGVGTAGDYYLVSTGGVWNGITFTEGQTVIYSGTIWQRAGGASGVTSVALTAPAAFTVSGSPIVSTGTLAISAAGTTAQYISGAGTLVSFPTNLVTTARTVNTTSPLQGGGALSSDLTLTIQQAGNLTNGYLSGADWATFMNKESTLTFYSPLFRSGSSVFITQATTSASGYITSTDWNLFNGKQSPLTGTGIVKSTAGVISYLTDNTANWDSAYNNTIVSASVTGTTTKTLTLTQQDAGTITASWTDLNTDTVTSVFGRTGAIVSATGDYVTGQILEAGNLYYTNARARASISLTTTGNNGPSSYDNINGILNVPAYTLAGLNGQIQLNGTGFVRAAGTTITYDNTSYTPTSRTLTINSVTYDLSANRNWDILTMVYPGAGIAVSTGTAWGTSIIDNSANWNAAYAARIVTTNSPLSFSGNTLSIAQSSSVANGYLSSTDWSTFNNKLNGSGLTAGKVPFATGSNSIADTNVNYNGGLVGFGTAADTYRVSVAGSINVTGSYYINGVAIGTLTSVTATAPLSSSGGTTPNITISQAGNLSNGYLSAADWATFMNKESTLTFYSPLFRSGSSVFIYQSNTTTNGYLSSTDWNTFNNKQPALGYTPYNATNPAGYVTSASLASYLPLAGGDMTGQVNFANNLGTCLFGQMGDSDQWRIYAGNTGSNAGYLEIATSDDATEPIYVRQYTGVFGSLIRTAKLLDESGNTIFPGYLGAFNFSGSSSGTNTGDQNLGGLVPYTGAIANVDLGTSYSMTASAFYESSDKSIKTLIKDNYQVDGISDITPKLYTKNGVDELGYYAQDFEGILDTAVKKSDDGLLSLSYREVLVAKVYALEQKIKELESKLK